MTTSSTTTPTAAGRPIPSTDRPTRPADHPDLLLGDVVMVCLDVGVWRPMTVSSIYQEAGAPLRLGGTIHCDPADHTLKAFRGYLDTQPGTARIHGRPERHAPIGYGEDLTEGVAIGCWRRRA